jgi:sulfate transport system permease protein
MWTVARERRSLPGFGLTLGLTMLYVSLLVLIPIVVVFIEPLDQTRHP